ncbi:MAG: MMPL family transporter [Candidatus Methanogranum gryphiswaldense]|nr:MAG: MMPL family transporter [Candidatus Methanogranum sp. U3.2.1]
MIFQKLANGITKHSKLIIAIWIIALIIAVPFFSKAVDTLNYNSDDMADSNSESSVGAQIIADYFVSSSGESNSTDLLIITYDDEAGKTASEEVEAELVLNYSEFMDGALKIIIPYEDYSNADGSGMRMIAIIFSDQAVSDGSYTDDTKELREWIATYTEKAEKENDAALSTYVTGNPAISYDIMTGSTEDISHIDIFSIALILILVGLFFRSVFASALPPITIGVAIAIAFLGLFFVGSVMDIFFITEMFIIVSMLGAGCDYCIFIVSRYREERRKGADHDTAIHEAIVWAGESITTSGIAVMIGFGAMSICSLSLISGMGVMLAIGIAIALLAALTLITSILNLLGERIFWPSKIESYQEGSKAMNGWYGKCARFGNKYFHKSVKFSLAHAKAIVVAAILFTVPMVYVVATAETSYDMVGTMLTGESQEGLDVIEEYTYGGLIMPDYEVLELEDSIATITTTTISGQTVYLLTWNSNYTTYYDKLTELSSTISSNDSNIGEAYSLQVWANIADAAIESVGPQETGETDSEYLLRLYTNNEKTGILDDTTIIPSSLNIYMETIYLLTAAAIAEGEELSYDNTTYGAMVDGTMNYTTGIVGGITNADNTISVTYVKMTIITNEQSMSDKSMDSLHTIHAEVSSFLENNEEFTQAWLTGSAAVMYEVSEEVNGEFAKIIALAVILIFILLFFVIKSYLTPLRSIVTILMSVVWTIAITHLVFSDIGLIWLIPIVLVVICLGLGMDYDILLTTRIKENHLHRGMSNDDAITEAVISSGSVITICGLIMGGAFGTLMISNMVMLQQFGFALAFAIIVDALIVRTYIVPAVMHLMGEWCWKGPKFLKKKEHPTEEIPKTP